MAGSIGHVLDKGRYVGWQLLENRRDAIEAVEEFAFALLATTTAAQRKKALAHFYACSRGEKPWPKWWKPNHLRESGT